MQTSPNDMSTDTALDPPASVAGGNRQSFSSEKSLNESITAAKSEIEVLKAKLKKTKEELADASSMFVIILSLVPEVAQRMNITPITPSNFKSRKTLKGHSAKIYSMQWAPSQPYIVSAGQDGKLILWNGISGNKMLAIPLRSAWVMSCSFSPSGSLIGSGGLDNKISIWEALLKDSPSVLPSRPLAELIGHFGYVSCIRFISEDQLISSSGDTSSILWDLQRSKPVLRFEEHDADVMSIDVDPERSILVSGACDALLKTWDTRTGQCVRTFAGHDSDINAVRFFPDRYVIGTGSDDGSCRLFDIRYDGEINSLYDASVAGGVTSVDFSTSGRLLFAAYDDNNVSVWDTLLGTRVAILSGHSNRVSSLGISSDGYALCTASWDGNLKIWTR